jgi:hypothetical protein
MKWRVVRGGPRWSCRTTVVARLAVGAGCWTGIAMPIGPRPGLQSRLACPVGSWLARVGAAAVVRA